MARPKIYQYPACGTCKKALAWLKSHGQSVDSVNIVEAPPSEAELSALMKKANLPVKAWFNTSGEVYRSQGYKERVPSMDAASAARELAQNGKLIKRPVLVHGSSVLVGFDAEAYARLFGE
jgi:arsenate reductase (glutaredoxin)